MKPINFPEATAFYPAFTATKDGPEKTPLHFYQDPGGFVVSCWEPTSEEIDEIIANKKIYVILPLKQQPSLSLMTSSPFKSPILKVNGKPYESKNKKGSGNNE